MRDLPPLWRSVPQNPIGGRSERSASRRAGQAGLEPQDRLSVELRNARLGHAQHLADLAQRQLLVVVEGDDELLAFRQARDRVAERLAELSLCERRLRMWPPGVLDRVDQGHLVAARRDRPELVERRDRRAGDLRHRVIELLLTQSESIGDLLVRGSAAKLALELDDRALDVARAGADRPRHPVHRAKLVDDRTLDPRDRVRLEFDVPVRVVALDGVDQTEQAVRNKVVLLDVRREAATEATSDELDERRIGEDEAVADLLVSRAAVLPPEALRVL